MVKTLTGTSVGVNEPWSGDNDAGTLLVDGTYSYLLSYREAGTSVYTGSLAGTLELDQSLPAAQFSEATASQVIVAGPYTIEGTAVAGEEITYRLDYAPGVAPAEIDFIELASGQGAYSYAIAELLQGGLGEGVYTIRLVVTGVVSGATAETRFTLTILSADAIVATPGVFAPTGNGWYEYSAISTHTSLPVDWTLEALDAFGNVRRQWNGEGAVVAATWDTQEPDGDYTFRLTATEPESGATILVDGGSVNIDTTPPTVSIDTPTEGYTHLTYDALDVTGTATDPHHRNFVLAWGQGAAPDPYDGTITNKWYEPVVGGSLGALPADSMNAPVYGPIVTLRLQSWDSVINYAEETRQINLDRLGVESFSVSPEVIDPNAPLSQSATIAYELTSPADVTIKIHPIGEASVTRSLPVQLNQTSGTLDWDGRTDSADIAPNAAYTVSMTASDAAGRSLTYSPPLDPVIGGVQPMVMSTTYNGYPNLSSTTGLDPHKNELLKIDYVLSKPARHRVYIIPPSGTPTLVTLLDGEAVPSGLTSVVWDGRLETGDVHSGGYSVAYVVPPGAIDRYVVFVDSPAVQITNLEVNPYLFRPMYDETAHIRFVLTRDASVTIEVVDPDNNFTADLFSGPLLAADDHMWTWDGIDDQNKVVAVEGVYEIRITATDTTTGESTTRVGALTVAY